MISVQSLRSELHEHLEMMRHHKGKRWVLIVTSTGVDRVGLESRRCTSMMQAWGDCVAGIYNSSATVDDMLEDVLEVAIQRRFMLGATRG